MTQCTWLRLYKTARWQRMRERQLPRETVESVMDDFDPEQDHADMPVFMGIDLSGSKDMTVLACVVPTGFMEMERDDGATVSLPTFDAWG